MNTNQSKTQIGELISGSGVSSKNLVNDLDVNDLEKNLPPIVLEYINYWNSFID